MSYCLSPSAYHPPGLFSTAVLAFFILVVFLTRNFLLVVVAQNYHARGVQGTAFRSSADGALGHGHDHGVCM
jgi:hypothetical protein